MKRLSLIVSVVLLAGFFTRAGAQKVVEESSGVVQIKMTKKKPVQEKTQSAESETRAVEFSQSTNIQMKKEAPKPVEPVSAGNISWITPSTTTVRTSEDSYQIKATVNAMEAIRMVNIFSNDEFVKFINPPAPNMRQMVVDQIIDLALGPNRLRFEAVTVSGKKIESNLDIVYDFANATYHALVIAVDEYDDHNLNDLDHPVKDAGRFIDIITSEYNFSKENVTFLRNPTKSDIIGTLDQMRYKVSPQDNFLIYYAGHGLYDNDMETGFWLPRDAARDNRVDWLANTDLTNYLKAIKSKHTLLIADACFSGGIFKTRAAFNNAATVEKLYKEQSRKAITSGALEEVPDKSVFVQYLIKRLHEYNKKYLPAEELYTSLRDPVMNNSNTMPKYGTIQGVNDEGGDFIFIRKD